MNSTMSTRYPTLVPVVIFLCRSQVYALWELKYSGTTKRRYDSQLREDISSYASPA